MSTNKTKSYMIGDATATGISLLTAASKTAARDVLELGTIALQAAAAVAITGGAITGITDLAVADGGTGASTKAAARTSLEVPGLADTNTYTGSNTFAAATTLQHGAFSATGASAGTRLAGNSIIQSSRETTGGLAHQRYYNPNGEVGGITTNGLSTNFLTSSDGGLKDNIITADKAAAIAKVKAGRPVDFEFKAEPGVRHLGFIAQEMHTVFPDAVMPGDGDRPWMTDNSKLVPVLWAVVQDLLARIEALESAQ